MRAPRGGIVLQVEREASEEQAERETAGPGGQQRAAREAVEARCTM